MKKFLLFALILLSLFLFVSLNLNQKALQKVSAEKDVLPSDLKRTLTLKDNVLTFKSRISLRGKQAGSSPLSKEILKSESHYIPPEGSFGYFEFADGKDKLSIKNYGFVLRFYAGGIYAPRGGFSPLGGVRLFYFGRWGAGAAYSLKNGFLLSAERRLDDILPLKNTAVFLGVNKNTAALGAVVFL